ncbi:MAG: hypothetical protein JOZ96_24310 [Acidobacteria bacterium]|nr:hypothetical protein [Acidobacteriota bacterium]
MLLLFHGELLAFIPALFFLGLAALLVAALVWFGLAKGDEYARQLAAAAAAVCLLIGVGFAAIFLAEFKYWLQYRP